MPGVAPSLNALYNSAPTHPSLIMTQHTKSFFTQSPITFLYCPSPSTPLLPHNHHPLPLVQVFKPNKVNGFDVQTEGEARVEAGKHKPKKLTAKARLVRDGYSTHRPTDRRTDIAIRHLQHKFAYRLSVSPHVHASTFVLRKSPNA